MSVPSPTAKPVPMNWNGGVRVRSYVPMATIESLTRAIVACGSAAAGRHAAASEQRAERCRAMQQARTATNGVHSFSCGRGSGHDGRRLGDVGSYGWRSLRNSRMTRFT